MGIEVIKLYDASTINFHLGNEDNDPPALETVNLYSISKGYVNNLGYVLSGFKFVRETVSYRHRTSLSFKNIISYRVLKKQIKANLPIICITNAWYDSYYHFTLECLPKLFLLSSFIESSTLIFPKKHSSFHAEWLQLLNVKDIHFVDDNELLTSCIRTTSFPERDLNHHDVISPKFRDWLVQKLDLLEVKKTKKIFIGRKNPKHRKLLNTSEVMSFLIPYGYEYVEMENLKVIEQLQLFRSATHIIAVHGASLANLCVSNAGTTVIDLMHVDFKQWCFYKLSKVLNLNYKILQCEGDTNDKLPGHRDIWVNVTELSKLIHI